ncbi:succinylglutamate desuccinylase/aspartoacylase family protein [Gaetbulibacter aestuarii]|uniref:Succinylglutamate desuccinylase/aspartoacylase family protein n=1 Tax=Gaetbulibacter aestuarii TaxID=1502358 RepID=A0ABW7MUW4_9FLAO
MTEVFSKAILQKIEVNRFIGKVNGTRPGPSVIFFGGIHGNENSGVVALKKLFETLRPEAFCGSVYGISGNLKALEIHRRFIEKDLNRLWTLENIKKIRSKKNPNSEESELLKILNIIEFIISYNQPPFYFIDLHSTSSKTLPFITINDALINRKFSKQFPVPIILGIEEYLTGPLLSYINQLGYVSLGFESGQHDDISAINNSVAFINLALKYSGVLSTQSPKMDNYFNELKFQSANLNDIFEIIYLYRIHDGETFKMDDGFKSFQSIHRGKPLARSNSKIIKAPYTGRVFMPLYQTQGAEGFFIIRVIPPIFLKLSSWFRHLKLDQLLVILPGVSWANKKQGVLQVNLSIARFFAKSLFHLLGYRHRQVTRKRLLLYNRERVAKTAMYKKEQWYW